MIGDVGFLHRTLTGEIAHIVGATDAADSPRGESELSFEERAAARNLILLCHDCHRKVDSRGMADYYTEEALAKLKEKHESHVRHATDFSTLAPTLVLRLTARVRGALAYATDRQMSESLKAEDLRPGTEDARDSLFDIELPDPETVDWSWTRAEGLIADRVEVVRTRSAEGGIGTLAVFALAPIPTLVLLGYYVDDKSDVRVMPSMRRDDDARWMWPIDPGDPTRFDVRANQGRGNADAVLISINVTADVDRAAIPDRLRALPEFELFASTQGPASISSRESLAAFGASWRGLMARVESEFHDVQTIHVIAAIPATAAIELGRAYMKDAQPEMVIYQREADGYVAAVTLH
ncbi:MAG: SAVED domain-containing protein [Pseudolysinimonas sp.]